MSVYLSPQDSHGAPSNGYAQGPLYTAPSDLTGATNGSSVSIKTDQVGADTVSQEESSRRSRFSLSPNLGSTRRPRSSSPFGFGQSLEARKQNLAGDAIGGMPAVIAGSNLLGIPFPDASIGPEMLVLINSLLKKNEQTFRTIASTRLGQLHRVTFVRTTTDGGWVNPHHLSEQAYKRTTIWHYKILPEGEHFELADYDERGEPLPINSDGILSYADVPDGEQNQRGVYCYIAESGVDKWMMTTQSVLENKTVTCLERRPKSIDHHSGFEARHFRFRLFDLPQAL